MGGGHPRRSGIGTISVGGDARGKQHHHHLIGNGDGDGSGGGNNGGSGGGADSQVPHIVDGQQHGGGVDDCAPLTGAPGTNKQQVAPGSWWPWQRPAPSHPPQTR